MLSRSWHDFVQVDEDGRIVAVTPYDWERILGVSHDDHVSAPSNVLETHPNGGSTPGSLSDEDGGDLIPVNLTAGQTYTWSYRGTGENGIVDPWLRLIGTDGTTMITEDDDGGLGRTSQITFTPTADGTYYLNATSWYQVDPTAPDYHDNGDYTIVQWSPEAGHDAGSTLGTAGTIAIGTNYLNHEAAGDRDYYAVQLTAGNVYSFTYNGGIGGSGDADGEPGEIIPIMGLYNSAGSALTGLFVSTSGELTLNLVPETSGTYYVRAEPGSNFGFGAAGQTGGYTIDIAEIDPATRDPLESLHWDSANNVPLTDTDGDGVGDTAFVYFAPPGENFGEKEPDGVTPMTTYGWEQHQIDAVMHALQTQYTPITGINYAITDDVDQAVFRMLTTENQAYGARFYPQDPAYGTQQGIGTFNLISGGFGTRPESLVPGGFSYGVILHEFGHAHGVAHPHDTGGGSEVMLGVTASTGSYGLYNLNQGVYTVMSYNDAWDFHPDGPTSEAPNGSIGQVIDHGWSETLGAFDIAVLQARYGVHAHNDGDTVYSLTDNYLEASYKTIWDTSGSDTIAYTGDLDAHIDLLAATLDYSPTGGGVISFLHNVPGTAWQQEVKGGFTIANGVVIENATGGSGDDVLIGQSANNQLRGNAGIDVLLGREGDDKLYGGDGDDELNGGAGNDQLFGGAGNDLFVFTEGGTDHIKDYQAGEKIDLSALGVTMDDVSVAKQFVLVDLDGSQDLRIMFNTKNFDTDDLVFDAESSTAVSATASGGTDGGGEADSLFRPMLWYQEAAMIGDALIV